jgi:hypothetical protein
MQKLRSFFFSKDILSFLLFFAISAGFWFIHSLGKEREKTISVPIHYAGIPLNVALTNSPPTEIYINIKDQGISLFDYSDQLLTPLTIDVSRNFLSKGKILISSYELKNRIVKYLKPTASVLQIRPDSILLQYEKLSEKVVPIQLYSKMELAHQYKFSDNLRIEPNKITVYGPKKILDTLRTVQTECLVLKNLNDTVIRVCKLKPVKFLRFSIPETRVSIFAEQFTEGKAPVPVTVMNCPENLSIRTFPAIVNITYIVGISRFNKFNPSDIQVFIDYNELKSNQTGKYSLKIKNNSSYLSNIRISPSEVEYILEQK